MIVLLEDAEVWSLMMLISAIAIDNAEISEDAIEEIRLWRSEHRDESEKLANLTDELNEALNAHIDQTLMRRVKHLGRYETKRT